MLKTRFEPITLFLAEHGKAELIVGVDVVKSMIHVAKINAIKKGLNHKTCFLICDGRHLTGRSGP